MNNINNNDLHSMPKMVILHELSLNQWNDNGRVDFFIEIIYYY